MGKFRWTIEEYPKHVKYIFVGLITVLLLVILFLQSIRTNKENSIEDFVLEELVTESATEEIITVSSTEDKPETNDLPEVKKEKILIDLKGAVQFPGVYEMESDHRVIDCVNKGGGFLEDAEEKAVNLAQRVEDQMVIYIPTKGEELPIANQIATITEENKQDSKNNQTINLNTATKEELKTLNGIGDVKAENIINYREANGFFQKIEDIKKVSGIGELTFEKLKEGLSVGP